MTKKTLLIILALFLFVSCIQKIDRPSRIDASLYFPLNIGDEYIYSGDVRKVVTSNDIEHLFTKTYLDSTGNVIRREDFVRTDNSVMLKSRFSVSSSTPIINFDPPLPYSPWTNLIGDTLLVKIVEIRADSINSHLRAQVTYETMAIDTVWTPSGSFPDCIKIKMVYRLLDEAESSFIDGE
ncbi:MAG: hypothetical protein GY865_19975, partial [candidate division Zixibacteria bacterium]|nr:hypothetical protein [candidate division Zixibacteria bacterium]